MAKVCIICEKEPQGSAARVRDDFIIKTIRAVKQRLGVAKNNELYVCEGCLPPYREKRKKFEHNTIFYIAIGVIIFVLVNALQVMYGKFSIATFFASLFLGAIVAVLPILNYATPPIEERQQPAEKKAAGAKKAVKKARK